MAENRLSPMRIGDEPEYSTNPWTKSSPSASARNRKPFVSDGSDSVGGPAAMLSQFVHDERLDEWAHCRIASGNRPAQLGVRIQPVRRLSASPQQPIREDMAQLGI